MDVMFALLERFTSFLFNWESRLAVIYLCATVVLVYVLWILRGRSGSFTAYLLPKETYLHKSNLVDIKIFLFNSLLSVAGIFTMLTFTPAMTIFLLDALLTASGSQRPDAAAPIAWTTTLIATVIMILTMDFCVYWIHRIHHEVQSLWPYHAVHHSAEVMTPLTVNRKHPMYILFGILFRGFVIGTVQALMLFLVVGKVNVLTIGSVNAGYFLFNALGSNLRHSHIWLSYGRVLEHIFISPAQHHIHHSIERKHYNKNYGEVFAFWDWMFGTLYVPASYENINYGLSDEEGNRIEQPHPTLRAALLHPFVESWEALWKGTSRDPDLTPDADQTALQ
ncbi:sterol desaturase family protein [uncultured Roseobacter sp.]|uniref:sterol desaturase family protein n=1 Tax=uncultured Roseobacter sp. TaxID=114847 RepID=UPI0026320680|nr:sterol desaturase family protein [uncultured Roseobacter sp.]